MELMELEMFVAIVEERSFRRAADRVSRTQPAVSMALRRLENQAGTTLIERSRRGGCRLTAAGELLYECASRMIAMRDEAKSLLRGEKLFCAGRLALGASGTSSLQRLSQLTAEFRAAHPLVRVEISSDEADKLLSEVADRKLDGAFLSAQPDKQAGCGFVLNPLRGLRPGTTLWLALPRAGRSHTLRMFEEMVAAQSAFATRTTAKRAQLCPSPSGVGRKSLRRSA